MYCIVGNFRGRKLPWLWGYSRKFSPRNFGEWHPLAWQKCAIRESFLRKNRIFHQFAKVFSLESSPLYGSCFVKWGSSNTNWHMHNFSTYQYCCYSKCITVHSNATGVLLIPVQSEPGWTITHLSFAEMLVTGSSYARVWCYCMWFLWQQCSFWKSEECRAYEQ